MTSKKRLVAYVSDELAEYCKSESKLLGMTQGMFIRFLLLQNKNEVTIRRNKKGKMQNAD